MNMKKILSGVLSAAMLLSMTSMVMAEESDIMLISEEAQEEVSTYDKMILKGAVKEASEEQIIFTDGEADFAINFDENTIFLNEKGETITSSDIKAEDNMMIVSSTIQTRSLPPQSYGYLLAKADGDVMPTYIEAQAVSTDDAGNIIVASADGQYEAVISKETEGVDENLIKEGAKMLVYSNMMTMSIPAVIPAQKVLFFEEVEVEVTVFDKVTVNSAELEISVKDGLLPVRAISEALGLQVSWDDTLKAVTVGTTPMGVNFNIGENKYNKAKMAATELSQAPTLIEDRTYVPVDFFTDILEAAVTIVNGQINIAL